MGRPPGNRRARARPARLPAGPRYQPRGGKGSLGRCPGRVPLRARLLGGRRPLRRAAPGGLRVAAEAVSFHIPVMPAAAVACLPVFKTGLQIDRWEGGLFLVYYAAYVFLQALAAGGRQGPVSWVAAVAGFLVPMTALTLVVVATRGAP
jgi:hypothetical protein